MFPRLISYFAQSMSIFLLFGSFDLAYCAINEPTKGLLFQGCFYEQKAILDNTILTTDLGRGCTEDWIGVYGLILFENGNFWYHSRQTLQFPSFTGPPIVSVTIQKGYGTYTFLGEKVIGVTDDGKKKFKFTPQDNGTLFLMPDGDYYYTSTQLFHYYDLKILPFLNYYGAVIFDPQNQMFTPMQSIHNIILYQPQNWSDKIVVSTTTGTNTDSAPLTVNDTLYLDFAVTNEIDADINIQFTHTLYLDGVKKESWISDSLQAGYYAIFLDYPIGKLNKGTHLIKIVTDSTNAIKESNEQDNSYTKTITVTDAVGKSMPWLPLLLEE